MATLHVAITGRDRRHLTELGAKLRVVVVGYREDRRGIVVDAYVPAGKVEWLRKKGYGVTPLEAVDAHARSRRDHVEARTCQAARQHVEVHLVVFHDQDLLVHRVDSLVRA